MALRIDLLRRWLGITAVLVIVLVTGTYFYLRYRAREVVTSVEKRLGVTIQQSTTGFTFSKSEGGRTLFTIKADKAIQLSAGGRTRLQNVSIVVYGRQSNRFDRIYGSEFAYDPASGQVSAEGDVDIDLQSDTGALARPDQSPPAAPGRNPIHLKTRGLVFNQKTGVASTQENIEFDLPRGSGSARGALYDSHQGVLTLQSALHLTTTAAVLKKGLPAASQAETSARPGQPTTLDASHGVFTTQPRRATLDGVRLQQPDQQVEAGQVTIFLRPDNQVESAVATGNVRMTQKASGAGGGVNTMRGDRAEAAVNSRGGFQTVRMSGGVVMDSTGAPSRHATAGVVTMDFAGDNRVLKARASDHVNIRQGTAAPGQKLLRIESAAIDFFRDGGSASLNRATTSGPAQILIAENGAAENSAAMGAAAPHSNATNAAKTSSRTVITAGSFSALIDAAGATRVHGEPNARIVSETPGQPVRTSTSRQLDVVLPPAAASARSSAKSSETSGGISSVVQQGDVRIEESDRVATAGQANYNPGDQSLLLTGSPRVTEGAIITTAHAISLSGRSGEASASGEVKTTYNQGQGSGGALFSSADPIHATGEEMVARRATSTAVYSGGARLWQGVNIIQAPVIEFDQTAQAIRATGQSATGKQSVSCVLVQTNARGKTVPVNIHSARLVYSDKNRKARFDGGVTMTAEDGITHADHVDVILYPARRGPSAPLTNGAPSSQLKEVIAEGHVVVEQPTRKVSGSRLVYTAQEGKFVVTGTPQEPPSIFDAEQGKVTGETLTFYNRDDRVRIDSGDLTRTLTQTRVKK